MKPEHLGRRRARVARVLAKSPPAIAVELELAPPSEDPELLGRFARWLEKMLNEPATPEDRRR